MVKLEESYSLDSKLYDLWRFSTRDVASHILFAQHLNTLIELIKKNNHLASILPLDDIITMSIYHLLSLIMKKTSNDVEVVQPFRTIYLESICQIYSSLDRSRSYSMDEEERREVDNDEFVTRVNGSEKLVNAANLFSRFSRQKNYSVLVDRRKRLYVNPLDEGINKSIDDLRYKNERLALYIDTFPKPKVKLVRRESNDLIWNSSIKIELLKVSREMKNLSNRLKFMNDYKISVYNDLSNVVDNFKDLVRTKINNYVSKKKNSDFIKVNDETNYKDSIHTLQYVYEVEDDNLNENNNNDIEGVQGEDASVISSARSRLSNSCNEKYDQSFKHDYVNTLFQFESDHMESYDSFKCVHYYQLGSDLISNDNNVHNNVYNNVCTNVCVCHEERDGVDDHMIIVEQDSECVIFNPPNTKREGVDSENETVADELVEIESSYNENFNSVIVDRDSGKNIESLIVDMYKRSCNVYDERDEIACIKDESDKLDKSVKDIESSSTCGRYEIIEADGYQLLVGGDKGVSKCHGLFKRLRFCGNICKTSRLG